ncbi:MAG: hypothetical protein MZV63_46745 [Marinilabiliales bacterium]|nr:hypothetical protein [Marinilabiliales bacterium]
MYVYGSEDRAARRGLGHHVGVVRTDRRGDREALRERGPYRRRQRSLPRQTSSASTRPDRKATGIKGVFLDQLRLDPGLTILAVGTERGRIPGGPAASRTTRSGPVQRARPLGERWCSRPVLEDGSFGAPNQSAAGYDPRRRPWYRAAIAAGGPAWSAPTRCTRTPTSPWRLPPRFPADGTVIGVATATITLGTLSEYLAANQARPKTASSTSAGADGLLVASSSASVLDAAGLPATSACRPRGSRCSRPPPKRRRSRRPGTGRPGTADSRSAWTASSFLGRAVPFAPNLDLDWTIVIAVEERSYAGKLLEADIRNFVLFVLFLATSFVVGWFVVDYVTKPIRALADGVDILEPGSAVPRELSAFAMRRNEFGRLSRSFLAMKIRLDESFGSIEASLAEKEVLLKEVHHRVKNNLQIVSSILSIQSGTVVDEAAKEAFEDCQDRIQAMALVHEEVYQTGSFVELGMSGYLHRICETLHWGRIRGACQTAFAVDVAEDAALSPRQGHPLRPRRQRTRHQRAQARLPGQGPGHRDGVVPPATASPGRLLVADDGVGIDAAGKAALSGTPGDRPRGHRRTARPGPRVPARRDHRLRRDARRRDGWSASISPSESPGSSAVKRRPARLNVAVFSIPCVY